MVLEKSPSILSFSPHCRRQEHFSPSPLPLQFPSSPPSAVPLFPSFLNSPPLLFKYSSLFSSPAPSSNPNHSFIPSFLQFPHLSIYSIPFLSSFPLLPYPFSQLLSFLSYHPHSLYSLPFFPPLRVRFPCPFPVQHTVRSTSSPSPE